MKSGRRPPRDQPEQEDAEVWKSEPGEPPITGPGDWLAMMVQGSKSEDDQQRADAEQDRDETTEAPPRKAISSIRKTRARRGRRPAA